MSGTNTNAAACSSAGSAPVADTTTSTTASSPSATVTSSVAASRLMMRGCGGSVKLAGGGVGVDHSQAVLLQLHAKGGPPLKATLPISSVLRGPIASGAMLQAAAASASSSPATATISGGGGGVFGALSPPPLLLSQTQSVAGGGGGGGAPSSLLLRHISPPEFAVCGHRSPGGMSYTGVPRAGCTATASNTSSAAGSPSSLQLQQQQQRLTLHPQTTPPMQRTASLDVLYQRPSVVFVSQQQQHQQHLLAMSSAASTDVHCSATQVHKSTQTLESYLEQRNDGATVAVMCASLPALVRPEPLLAGSEPKIDKVLRQRLQRTGTSGGGITVMAVVGTQFGAGEHSVSSQTHSPHHVKAIPVTIPIRPIPGNTRPMRSSVEGLNQEIEKLVLQPDQPHTCRPETNLFSRGETPEGHRAPLVDLLHSGGACGGAIGGGGAARRSVNTQTPSREFLSSDESQSTSPDDCASNSGTGASPRINRFLAREPPDGCEKVSLKLTEADQQMPSGQTHLFKPCVGFRLRPSLGSAFQPIVASSRSSQAPPVETSTSSPASIDFGATAGAAAVADDLTK